MYYCWNCKNYYDYINQVETYVSTDEGQSYDFIDELRCDSCYLQEDTEDDLDD